MVKVCGKVVYVKGDKNEKTGRHFKRVQLLSSGGGVRSVLYDLTDMANENWVEGADVEVRCAIDVYQGKRGISYSLTHWGQGDGVKQESSVVGPPPGDSASAVGGGGVAKSSGKFS